MRSSRHCFCIYCPTIITHLIIVKYPDIANQSNCAILGGSHVAYTKHKYVHVCIHSKRVRVLYVHEHTAHWPQKLNVMCMYQSIHTHTGRKYRKIKRKREAKIHGTCTHTHTHTYTHAHTHTHAHTRTNHDRHFPFQTIKNATLRCHKILPDRSFILQSNNGQICHPKEHCFCSLNVTDEIPLL